MADKIMAKARLLETLLPTPPRENLNTHFILGEIIDQIDLIRDDFPFVKIATLKEHLWDIRNKNVDPEIHLRGFLHVFKDTEVFRDAFNQLDEGIRLRIKAFMDGKSKKEVLDAGGKGVAGQLFMPPSPPVKHHFRKLAEGLKEGIEELLGHDHGAEKAEAPKKTVAEAAAGTQGNPRIFEDAAETKTMEVHANKGFCNWGRSVANTPEVTFGGVNGPVCHGAGRRHQTINDCVRAVEYVDANGLHRTISDPAHLGAAAGCFGLLGVVTHITFALDQMSYASMQPFKPDIGLAIPPLSRNDIPIALRKTFTDAQYAAGLADFKRRAQEDYKRGSNTWNATDDRERSVEYPSPFLTLIPCASWGNSNVIMAPQQGNTLGTASIEVISIPDAVTDNEWVPFLQRLADLWMGHGDAHGALLDVRPHWAREWESINMRGQPAWQYLKEYAYKDAIPEFKSTLASVGAGQGWGLTDIQERFSNELWDYMIYS
ncbi:hypothetical protein B2J93_7721 [Marssonina coronariae]|uniref:FAD-binding PCMH-type domain-containing protein n=1 Tax=Diplocarpon coronariae TaxID=2795749 RepID=A0A218ZG54_9HELO|nr:hypothetical protein B2J93_7721 [Marssonina coronariae]